MRRTILLVLFATAFAGTVAAQPSGNGDKARSVRHASSRKKSETRSTVARTTTRRTNTARRQGYRAGSRRGRYRGWNDARRSWRSSPLPTWTV